MYKYILSFQSSIIMAETRAPFYYLDKLVNVLLVDDDPEILSVLSEIFDPICLFSVYRASTSQQAEEILASPPRTHLCVFDLGLTDCKNDEFFLLKRFGTRVSFVIFTGRPSPLKGFNAHNLGAKAIIEKSGEFDTVAFFNTVSHFALLNIINPKHSAVINDSLSVSTDLLFEKSPQFVSQWAQMMGMTDRALRHIWTKNLGANAKIILSTYQIFETAFNYFEKIILESEKYKIEKIIQSNTYRRLEEFFHLHRSTICDFISYGDVAAFL